MALPDRHHALRVAGPEVVLYHADCLDGFGAAWALWKRFPSASYRPVKHGYPPPAGLSGQRILIVDFSYPREQLERIAREATALLVLDHHITAQQALEGLPYVCFEEKKSGAVMAWEWAHQTPVPWLLRYIQDKDLWLWELPASREINAALASYPYDFDVWERFRQDTLRVEGQAILRYEQEVVGKIAESAVLVEFQGETVPAVQSSVLTTQIGERLSRDYAFCIIWHDRDGRRFYSLRSHADGADVGKIAAAHGGGGHTHAAGFSVPLGEHSVSPLAPLRDSAGAPGREKDKQGRKDRA